MAKPFVAPPTFPFDHKRFLTITAELTAEQFRAYTLIMIATWRRGGKALPDDAKIMSKKLRCTEERWLKSIRPGLVVECAEGEEQIFDLSDGTFRMHEMEELWGFVQRKIAVKKANGKLGGRPPAVAFDLSFPNLTDETAREIEENQTANPLINNNSDEAIGSVSVPFSLSTNTKTYKEEESKKESPHVPPRGDGEDVSQIPVESQGSDTVASETVYRSQEPDRTLFPVQEVSRKPTRTRAPRVRDAEEIEAAFDDFKKAYPARNAPHTWSPSRTLFSNAMKAGVPAEVLINSARTYFRTMKLQGKIGTSSVADARTWLFQKRWEDYQDYQPKKPPSDGKVTSLHGGTSGQVPDEYVTRGGIRY